MGGRHKARKVHRVINRLVRREPGGVILGNNRQLSVVHGDLVWNVNRHCLRAVLINIESGIFHRATVYGNGNLSVVHHRHLIAQHIRCVMQDLLHIRGVVVGVQRVVQFRGRHVVT